MLSYAKVIREDPVRRGLLYLGTENAIYVSFDDGDTWQPLQNNLPHAPVSGIVVQEHFNDLVISTYGRGFWILDDITPLQQLTPEVLAAPAHLFAPRAAYRFRPITAPSHQLRRPHHRRGPGVRREPQLLAQGTGVRRTAPDDHRFHRPPGAHAARHATARGSTACSWDLTDEPGIETRLLTSPLYAPHIARGARRARRTRHLARSRCSSRPAATRSRSR